MGRRQNELRNAADLILELCIIVAVRSENQFLYANFRERRKESFLISCFVFAT